MLRKLYFAVTLLWILRDCTSSLDNSQNAKTVLTDEEKSYVFISEDIFQGIIPAIKECWSTLKTLKNGDMEVAEYTKQLFWNDILLKRLKPYHQSIRDIDQAVLNNRPSAVLNNVVNVTVIPRAFDLSEQVEVNKSVEWLDVVKDGWIKVAGMMAQLHFKYDWTLEHLYNAGRSANVAEDLMSLNNSLKQYFPWFQVKDLEMEPKRYDSIAVVSMCKEMASGELLPAKDQSKNLFLGLKELLNLEEKRLEEMTHAREDPSAVCAGTETISGKRSKVYRYLPVYVLLHLLNGEFKYFIMQNIAHMYRCLQSRQCDLNVSVSSAEHLQTFYRFYFDGIVKAFRDKDKATPLAGSVSVPVSVPNSAWRWRCDPKSVPDPEDPYDDQVPKLKHVEDVTFTRFYDYQTVFVAEEQGLSLTNTCRDSCDIFDGGFSSVPCKVNDTACVEQQKEFDCYGSRSRSLDTPVTCPKVSRSICPHGIKCTTTKLQKVQVCEGQRDGRHSEWIERGEGKIMGKKTACSPSGIKNLAAKTIVEEAGITKFGFENCEICMCKCFEPLTTRSHRFISLSPQLADIKNQKTLVGLKFIKIGEVIYPKIAQAKVKYGMPNDSTIEWMDPTPAQNLADAGSIFRLGRNAKNVLLDDILAPAGHVITGVRFVTVNCPIRGDYQLNSSSPSAVDDLEKQEFWNFTSLEQELALEVQVTALTDQGFLNPDSAVWMSNGQNTSLVRTQVMLDDADEPPLSDLPSITNSTSNQFISIQSSSLKRDFGQTPVPFFDTQDMIEVTNLTLVKGVGLFFKNRPGFGGFLGFRLISEPISDVPANPRYDLWHSTLPK